MAYELLFEEIRPAFELVVNQQIWKGLKIQVREQKEIDEYFEQKLRWRSMPSRIGFGGCGKVRMEGETVRVTLPLSRRSSRPVLLTLSFLLRHLYLPHGHKEYLLLVEMACAPKRHSIWGYVSGEFRSKLKLITDDDRETIVRKMRRAYTSVARKGHARFADKCLVWVSGEEERFTLGCFGDACDVSIYPDHCYGTGTSSEFSCHNLDFPFQQATLLAGLAALYECAKKAM